MGPKSKTTKTYDMGKSVDNDSKNTEASATIKTNKNSDADTSPRDDKEQGNELEQTIDEEGESSSLTYEEDRKIAEINLQVVTRKSISKKTTTKPSKQKQKFYAVRKCDSLKSPAIFLSWDDCKMHLKKDSEPSQEDGEKDEATEDDTLEYKIFDDFPDAMTFAYDYVNGFASVEPDSNDQTIGKKRSASSSVSSKSKKKAKSSPSVGNHSSSKANTSSTSEEAASTLLLSLSSIKPATKQNDSNKVPSNNKKEKKAKSKATTSTTATPKKKGRRPILDSKRHESVIQRRRDDKFSEMFQLLKDHKEEYGTCDMYTRDDGKKDIKYKGLGKWVSNVRNQIKIYQKQQEDRLSQETEREDDEGAKVSTTTTTTSTSALPTATSTATKAVGKQEKSELTGDQVQRLLDLGFCMVPQRTIGAVVTKVDPEKVSKWPVMYKQLQEFHAETGNCKVPEKNRSELRRWVVQQRQEYAKFQKGGVSVLDTTKISKLAALGFEFQGQKRVTFDERCLQWLQFKSTHNRNPIRDRPGEEDLASWINNCRVRREMLESGKKTCLTTEQVNRLTEWGFPWERKRIVPRKLDEDGNIKKNLSWDDRFQQLLDYKAKYGNTVVPQHYKEVHGLGGWVMKQRIFFKRFMKGEGKPSINQYKINKLQDIGFAFEARSTTGAQQRTGSGGNTQERQQQASAAGTLNNNNASVGVTDSVVAAGEKERGRMVHFYDDQQQQQRFSTW